MYTYGTPEPISVAVNLGMVAGNVRVAASDRADTTVEVVPADPGSKNDVKVAEQTKVEYTAGRLTVRAPKLTGLFTRSGAVNVTIEVPTGSEVEGETGMGEVRCEGQLADCRFKTGYGEMTVERAGTVALKSGMGDITVDHAEQGADITTGSGAVRLRRVDGPASVKNSNGTSWVGDAAGDLNVNGANGSISVDRADANVTARTASGGIRVGQVARGAVSLYTAAGALEVGIRAGTAAWLDLKTSAGRVRNELDEATGPDGSSETVEVRARTYVGDIVVRRS